jgi:hypothetical protein
MPLSDWNLAASEELGYGRALEEKAQINIFQCLVYYYRIHYIRDVEV